MCFLLLSEQKSAGVAIGAGIGIAAVVIIGAIIAALVIRRKKTNNYTPDKRGIYVLVEIIVSLALNMCTS